MQKKIKASQKTRLQRKVQDIQHLDNATQAIIMRIDKNDYRLRITAFFTLSVILILGTVGIYYQVHLATQNKQHIDCIIKDLSTPLPPGAKAKYIQYQTRLNADCKIKFN